MVEHLLAKERVESSNLFIRFPVPHPSRLVRQRFNTWVPPPMSSSVQEHELLAFDHTEAKAFVEAMAVGGH